MVERAHKWNNLLQDTDMQLQDTNKAPGKQREDGHELRL